MSRKPKYTPIEQRRLQIEKEIERLKLPKNKRTRHDFKSDEAFENWRERQERKLHELNEELIILDNPTEYNEIPLAIAATELGMTLNDMLQIVSEDLVEKSFDGEFPAGDRITRDELARVIEIGADELLRIANQSVEEIFEEAVQALHNGNVEAAEHAYNRIQRFEYERSYLYWNACSIGLHLLRGEFEEFAHAFDFVTYHDEIKLAAILKALRRAVEGIEPGDHLSAVVREQILAVADGLKETPFDSTYSSYETTEYFSQMDENQRHSMLLGNVVLEALKRYKFIKSIQSRRTSMSEKHEGEIERVIRNAIYTALEAESTYYDSASSKLFVDKFVELFPKRWVPAEHIVLLPKNKNRARDRQF
jgi:SHS2 domain-containing protein